MLNNLTNFFNLLAISRFKTKIDDTDVIALGTQTGRRVGSYKPTAIQGKDLKAQIIQIIQQNGGEAVDEWKEYIVDISAAQLRNLMNNPVQGFLPESPLPAGKMYDGEFEFLVYPGTEGTDYSSRIAQDLGTYLVAANSSSIGNLNSVFNFGVGTFIDGVTTQASLLNEVITLKVSGSTSDVFYLLLNKPFDYYLGVQGQINTDSLVGDCTAKLRIRYRIIDIP
jgi:hypothetical protein